MTLTKTFTLFATMGLYMVPVLGNQIGLTTSQVVWVYGRDDLRRSYSTMANRDAL